MPPLEIQPMSSEMIERSTLLHVNQDGYTIGFSKLQADANRHVPEFLSRYELCLQRANKLARALWKFDFASSHTQTACRSAVLVGLPIMLRQTAALVEKLATENGDELQSSLALDLTEQYLEIIERAISRDDVDLINQKLDCLISTQGRKEKAFSCSLSMGRTSELVFDLGLGSAVYFGAKEYIQVSAEPVLEIRTSDLLSGTLSSAIVRPYHVEIEYCRVHTLHFPTSSDRAGEAHISIKLTPVGSIGEKDPFVKEARICQTNSILPKQAISADMFTSCETGENSLKIRLVVNTFRTERNEAPNLMVKLVLLENRV